MVGGLSHFPVEHMILQSTSCLRVNIKLKQKQVSSQTAVLNCDFIFTSPGNFKNTDAWTPHQEFHSIVYVGIGIGYFKNVPRCFHLQPRNMRNWNEPLGQSKPASHHNLGTFWKKQKSGHHLRPIESESAFLTRSWWFLCILKFKKHCSRYTPPFWR